MTTLPSTKRPALVSALLLFSAVLLASVSAAWADITLTPSTTDLWDISQGATVTGNSPVYPGSDIRNMFGGNYGGVEPGDTIFADFQPQGTVDWVEWQTPAAIMLQSFALFAGPDTDANVRGFSRFSLYYWNTGAGQWTDIYDLFPANPYGNTIPPANSYIDPNPLYAQLELAANVAPVTAQFFRAEFVQYGPNTGPRVQELDGFSTPSPFVSEVPEPSTLIVWSLLGGLGISIGWRRRRKTLG